MTSPGFQYADRKGSFLSSLQCLKKDLLKWLRAGDGSAPESAPRRSRLRAEVGSAPEPAPESTFSHNLQSQVSSNKISKQATPPLFPLHYLVHCILNFKSVTTYYYKSDTNNTVLYGGRKFPNNKQHLTVFCQFTQCTAYQTLKVILLVLFFMVEDNFPTTNNT